MRIRKSFNLEAVASKDPTRANIFEVLNLRDDGTLEATNGRVIVRVPVQKLDTDKPGSIPAKALRYARANSEGKEVEIFPSGESVSTADGTVFKAHQGGEFPKTKEVFPTFTEENSVHFTVDAGMLLKALEAMGAINRPITFRISGSLEPIGLSAEIDSDKAVATLMPMRSFGEPSWKIKEGRLEK